MKVNGKQAKAWISLIITVNLSHSIIQTQHPRYHHLWNLTSTRIAASWLVPDCSHHHLTLNRPTEFQRNHNLLHSIFTGQCYNYVTHLYTKYMKFVILQKYLFAETEWILTKERKLFFIERQSGSLQNRQNFKAGREARGNINVLWPLQYWWS